MVMGYGLPVIAAVRVIRRKKAGALPVWKNKAASAPGG